MHGLTYLLAYHFSEGHPEDPPNMGSNRMAYNNAFISCSKPRSQQLTHSVGDPRNQLVPILTDPSGRCAPPQTKGCLHNPCRLRVTPKLSRQRPPSLVPGCTLRPQPEGGPNYVLSRSQQRPTIPNDAGPLTHFRVHEPGASFVRSALGVSNIVMDGSAPLPAVGASAAPCRGLKALPTTTLGYGCTPTNNGSPGGLTHAGNPFYCFSSWCPPYFLADRSIRGLSGGPSKRRPDLVDCDYIDVAFARPLAHLLTQVN